MHGMPVLWSGAKFHSGGGGGEQQTGSQAGIWSPQKPQKVSIGTFGNDCSFWRTSQKPKFPAQPSNRAVINLKTYFPDGSES